MLAGDYEVVRMQRAHARGQRLAKLINPQLRRHLDRKSVARTYWHMWRDTDDYAPEQQAIFRAALVVVVRKYQQENPKLGPWK